MKIVIRAWTSIMNMPFNLAQLSVLKPASMIFRKLHILCHE